MHHVSWDLHCTATVWAGVGMTIPLCKHQETSATSQTVCYSMQLIDHIGRWLFLPASDSAARDAGLITAIHNYNSMPGWPKVNLFCFCVSSVSVSFLWTPAKPLTQQKDVDKNPPIVHMKDQVPKHMEMHVSLDSRNRFAGRTAGKWGTAQQGLIFSFHEGRNLWFLITVWHSG